MRTRFGTLASPFFGIAVLAAYALSGAACGPTFKDETRSIVDKPTVIAVTLDPAEPRPGDVVTARFLMMDQYGRMEPGFQMWLRQSGTESLQFGAGSDTFLSLDPETAGEDFPAMLGLGDPSQAVLGVFPGFSFQLLDEEAYEFNAEGLTAESLFLAVPLLPIPLDLDALGAAFASDPDAAMEQLGPALAAFGESMENRQALKVLRTIPVSKREIRNENPVIRAVYVKAAKDASEKIPLVFASPEDPDNRKAIAEPFVYTLGETFAGQASDEGRVYFELEIEDEAADQDRDLRFQWFTTPGGGSFLNRQERVQRFGIPLVGIDGETSDNPRLDPALIPIFAVVRDVRAGDGYNMGQTWAEFYLRVQR